MLDNHEFCDHCSGCRPSILDTTTGRVLAEYSPTMIKINLVWDQETTYEQRKAFIDVTVHNSRKTEDVWLANIVVTKIQAVLNSCLH